MQNETNEGYKTRLISCLQKGSEMSNFCPKQDQVFMASAVNLYPNVNRVPPSVVKTRELTQGRF